MDARQIPKKLSVEEHQKFKELIKKEDWEGIKKWHEEYTPNLDVISIEQVVKVYQLELNVAKEKFLLNHVSKLTREETIKEADQDQDDYLNITEDLN